MMNLPYEVNTALEMLKNAGYEAYVVGGCVRDSLLGAVPKDHDITTSALPQQTEAVFKSFRVVETGIKHGTVTVIINGMPLEITTYRIDSEYVDCRRPTSVSFTKSLQEDTARRDFTMNAIAYNPTDGLADFHGGAEDINNRIIRCVGCPDERFQEDALRIMRAVRFSSVLGFNVENETKRSLFKNKALLDNISRERIASEFIKLLCGKDVFRVLTEYKEIIAQIIPEVSPMFGFDQHSRYHIYDVWEHTAKVTESIQNEPVLRLAAFFHDIGKPHCFSMKDGEGHFYGHASVSEGICKKVLSGLKLDNKTKDTVTQLVKLHDVQIDEAQAAVKRFMSRRSPELYYMLLKLKRADTLGQTPKVIDRLEMLDRMEKLADEVLSAEACFSLKDLSVNGSDIISLGVRPGRIVGQTLEALLEKVIAGELKNEKQELLASAKEILGVGEK